MNTTAQDLSGHRLLQFGAVLFLLGLLTGLVVPFAANPRMALASHLEGLMNGVFVLVLGLIWPRLNLSAGTLAVAFWLAIFGSLTNWLATLLAALWPAGSAMMPLAGRDYTGTQIQEAVLKVLLISLSMAMITLCVLVIFGLRRPNRSVAQ
ncbi:MAG TPA: hydrogenase [Thermoanaerobaculia bacterium]|nr:hydrogenase [Thermoanaerobaculia bacterium]